LFGFHRQVDVDDNEALTLELFPLYMIGITEQTYQAVNTIGLQRSLGNPHDHIDEQNVARSGLGHVHKLLYFITASRQVVTLYFSSF